MSQTILNQITRRLDRLFTATTNRPRRCRFCQAMVRPSAVAGCRCRGPRRAGLWAKLGG